MRAKVIPLSLLVAITLMSVPESLKVARAVQSSQIVPQVFGPGTLSTGEVYRGCFTPDGRAFYFFKKVTPDREDYRIFVSHQINGRWGAPDQVRLGGDFSDLYPAISKDGKRMVFSSYRPAPGDSSAKPNAHLWYVERERNGWGPPVFIATVNKLGHYHSWVEFGLSPAIGGSLKDGQVTGRIRPGIGFEERSICKPCYKTCATAREC
jgi:hypothetical protein